MGMGMAVKTSWKWLYRGGWGHIAWACIRLPTLWVQKRVTSTIGLSPCCSHWWRPWVSISDSLVGQSWKRTMRWSWKLQKSLQPTLQAQLKKRRPALPMPRGSCKDKRWVDMSSTASNVVRRSMHENLNVSQDACKDVTRVSQMWFLFLYSHMVGKLPFVLVANCCARRRLIKVNLQLQLGKNMQHLFPPSLFQTLRASRLCIVYMARSDYNCYT